MSAERNAPATGSGASSAAASRRFRLTTHMPLSGERIGLTLWFGSVDDGWKGWPVFKRGFTYKLTGEPNVHV